MPLSCRAINPYTSYMYKYCSCALNWRLRLIPDGLQRRFQQGRLSLPHAETERRTRHVRHVRNERSGHQQECSAAVDTFIRWSPTDKHHHCATEGIRHQCLFCQLSFIRYSKLKSLKSFKFRFRKFEVNGMRKLLIIISRELTRGDGKPGIAIWLNAIIKLQKVMI